MQNSNQNPTFSYINPFIINNTTYIEKSLFQTYTYYTISKYPNPQSLTSNTPYIKINNKKYYLHSKTFNQL